MKKAVVVLTLIMQSNLAYSAAFFTKIKPAHIAESEDVLQEASAKISPRIRNCMEQYRPTVLKNMILKPGEVDSYLMGFCKDLDQK